MSSAVRRLSHSPAQCPRWDVFLGGKIAGYIWWWNHGYCWLSVARSTKQPASYLPAADGTLDDAQTLVLEEFHGRN